MVGDTIVYQDSTRVVTARGDTVTVRDPTRNQDDIVSIGRVVYDVKTHEAMTTARAHGVSERRQSVDHRPPKPAPTRATPATHATTRPTRSTGWRVRITTCDDSFPALSLLGQRAQVRHQARAGRPPGGAVHCRRAGHVAAVRRSGSAHRAAERLADTAFRDQRAAYATAHPTAATSRMWATISTSTTIRISRRGSTGAAAPGASLDDPGWTRYSGIFRYHWLDRFVVGSFGLSYQTLSNNTTNTAISWQHQQDFSLTSHLEHEHELRDEHGDPADDVLQSRMPCWPSISSQLNYQQALGPAPTSAWAARRNNIRAARRSTGYFRRSACRRSRCSIGKWFTWTPSFSATNTRKPEHRPVRKLRLPVRGRPSARSTARAVQRNQRATTAHVRHADQDLRLHLAQLVPYLGPAEQLPRAGPRVLHAGRRPRHRDARATRVFSQTYNTSLDWNTGIDLPSLFAGQVEPRAERGDRERRPRRRLHDPHAVHRRQLRDAAEAPGVRPHRSRRRSTGSSPVSATSRASVTRSRRSSRSTTRRRRHQRSSSTQPRASRRSVRWPDCGRSRSRCRCPRTSRPSSRQAPMPIPTRRRKSRCCRSISIRSPTTSCERSRRIGR